MTATYATELITEITGIPPCCVHGPGLLFQRIGTASKNDRRKFYACSACRSRKECSLFMWEDEASQLPGSKTWETVSKRVVPRQSHEEIHERLAAALRYPASQRYFCCEKILLNSEVNKHKSHTNKVKLTDGKLRKPSQFIHADVTNTTKAQFFFTEECVLFIANLLRQLKYKHAICIGTPTIHEHLRQKCYDIDTLLLDIEQTYEQFYSVEDFCWYNMFNHFFFRGASAEAVLHKRLSDGSCAILIDPPFGGRVDAIAFTLKKILSLLSHPESSNIFWFFPYFNEKRVRDSMPTLQMLDYKVDYSNHDDFNEYRTKGSPVRIFTDVRLGRIELPADRYSYCDKCDRWVDVNNRHCDACGRCTAKDGGRYKHCSICAACVKHSHKHCNICQACRPSGHKCATRGVQCFLCKGQGHKSTDCLEKKGHEDSISKKRKHSS